MKGMKTYEALRVFHIQLQQLSLAVVFETKLPLRITDGRGNSTICGSSSPNQNGNLRQRFTGLAMISLLLMVEGTSIQNSFPLPSTFTGSKHMGGCFPPSTRGLKHSTRAAPVLETWDLWDLPNQSSWDQDAPKCWKRIARCFSVFHVCSFRYSWMAKHGQKIGDLWVIQRT